MQTKKMYSVIAIIVMAICAILAVIFLGGIRKGEELENHTFWGDQRDWTCGSIEQVERGTKKGDVLTVSLKYFVSVDDDVMIQKLGLSADDFPNGYDIVSAGSTKDFPVSKECNIVFIDWGKNFEEDSRVETYDDVHVCTNDFDVFEKYLSTYSSLENQVFFYDIQDGKIVSIYETWLP
ncbi:MAG: hypothetical protein K6G30_04645 [Acetatifactor sp.]|nr:hypothetical protein [Acetatifactor sp.]